MKIAILGAGFTGLTAAYRLLQIGHKVTVFEKEAGPGGLAIGFKKPDWKWSLEKAYHHWFTNDSAVLNLARELNHPIFTIRPKTAVLTKDLRLLQLDSAKSLLTFSPLPPLDRLRTGVATFYLKLLNDYQKLEGHKALPWIRKYMGGKSAKLIWEPLFMGKFGKFSEDIALSWFWARIKKRTPSLSYPIGGFQAFANNLEAKIKSLGGEILYNSEVKSLSSISNSTIIRTAQTSYRFDKTLVTLPSPVFAKITKHLPQNYIQKIGSIPHLHAQVLVLTSKRAFMKDYWLNITDEKFPFLVLAEHTNFIDKKYYGNEHILYIGNYLPANHPYLKMSAKQLLGVFDPYLKKINSNYHMSHVTCHLYIGPFAQPVVTNKYPKQIPTFVTPLKNIFLANLSMVYPWDRGTNYAVEMGEKVANLINEIKKN